MNPHISLEILKEATNQTFYALSSKNIILSEFAMALLLVVLRRINNNSL